MTKQETMFHQPVKEIQLIEEEEMKIEADTTKGKDRLIDRNHILIRDITMG
jgi:hypothetical protein